MAFLRDPCNQDHRSTLSFLRKSHIFYSLPQAFYVGPVEEVSTWTSIIIKFLLVEKRKILHNTKHSSPLFVALACNLPILERFDQILSLSSKQPSWSISASSSEIFLGILGITPRTAGSPKFTTLCYQNLPSLCDTHKHSNLFVSHIGILSFTILYLLLSS